ncbi:sulfatase-like hydrolase/transferase [Paenibacillus sp. PAMC21692]|uniref:sulfatase-like hydrolase/transferase n=1 Tax=Paenibacillus sp. PAMC21692 TaxID=2762320 RepID=UPI00164DDAE5|nr:sulfatase-like hydrolase/transferase [Paenibacillus sp. PAMC21692]QNK57374.1 sulfatase-like hydrolase/transferase [Paenibacillus sp. PAMC21692]
MMSQPNILLIVADQLRKTAVGAYGNRDVKTPVIDKLSREGVTFSNSVSASPVCAPYRTSLQSGLYPHQHGVRSNADLFKPSFKGLAEYFSEAGYETCFVGKSHFGLDEIEEKDGWVRPEHRLGWKHWCGTGGDHHWDTPIYDERGMLDTKYYGRYGAEVRSEIAMDFIERHQSKPWLLQLNYSEPHIATMPALYGMPATREYIRELNKSLELGLTEEMLNVANPLAFCGTFPQSLLTQLLPQRYLDMYGETELTLDPNVPERFRKLTSIFLKECYAMITCLDEQIGRVMDCLERTGESRNTIVIFTSDHGDMLSDNFLREKSLPYQNAYRTPFIAWGPEAGVPSGKGTDALINSVDVMPTLLELAGIKPATNLPGVSQANWITSGEGVCQQDVLLGVGNWRALFDGTYFYAVEKRDSTVKAIRLIHAQNDPYESENLLDDAFEGVYVELQKRMHERLFVRLAEVQDREFADTDR